MRYYLAGFISLIAAILLSGCHKDKSVVRLKLAHALDQTHPVHKAMEFMRDRLEEKSDGQMTIDIYPSNQLGNERECLELLQIGSLGMTKVSASVMGKLRSQL